MSVHYTTTGGFVLMIAKALDAYGLDGDAAMTSCGIQTQLLSDPDIRVPVDQLGLLLELAVRQTGDSAFGLKAGTFVCPTTFHALSMSMWLSPSLKDALIRGERYGQILSNAGRAALEEREHEYVHWVQFISEEKTFLQMLQPAALDALFSALISFCRAVYGQELAPIRVALIREEPEDISPYLDFFQCPVEFSQPRMSLTFDKETLEKPLSSSHPELLNHSDHVIVESLRRFDRSDVVGNLRAMMLESLPSGKPSQEKMAFALNLSLRSLQRKLKERGLTFERVLLEVRQDLAKKYIAQSHLSISDISYLLGFSSANNFARNFKSWMGATPSEYRRLHLE